MRELRAAIRDGRACVVQLMNYRRNGDAFVNYLSVTPIHDANGVLTHYVGVQASLKLVFEASGRRDITRCDIYTFDLAGAWDTIHDGTWSTT